MSHSSSQAPAVVDLVVGTYNQKGSEGIYGLRFDAATGEFGELTLLATADNPSYLAIGDGQRLYAVNETGDGRLSTFARLNDGRLSLLNSVLTRGASPCYVALSPDGRYIATANYMGGNVSVFPLDDNRVAASAPQLLQHQGRGPNQSRQEAPHAHWVQWDPQQTFLYAVDLGIDQVRLYPFDGDTGEIGEGRSALTLPPGEGPRHMVFHPNQPWVYVLNELGNTVTAALRDDDGQFRAFQHISTLPDGFREYSHAAHIYLSQDGKTLYTSNRGHDSIAVFRVGDEGQLSVLQWQPTEGDRPRHFTVLEDLRLLLVANQESHNLVVLRIAKDGTLEATGYATEVPQPTFIGRW